jgi:hypothetical protein
MADPALFPRAAARRKRRPRGLTLHVECGRRTAWLRGERVQGLLDRAQITARQWDPQHRCWSISITRADDVITAAEHLERRVVTVEAVER